MSIEPFLVLHCRSISSFLIFNLFMGFDIRISDLNMTKHTAYIGLGSNLGNQDENLNAALTALNKHPNVQEIRTSSFYKTKPLGTIDQTFFLNAVARVTTSLSYRSLLEFTQQIEKTMGRQRHQLWGPRIIDLDLLLYDDDVINESDLTVPHPQLHLRSFVLQGLCELSADLLHPKMGRKMSELYERLNGQDYFIPSEKPQLLSIAGIIGVGKTTLANELAERLGATYIPEKYDDNPYLSDVYNGHAELALDSELFFLSSGASQLTKKLLKAGSCYVSDYVFDKAMIYASVWLKGADFQKYLKHYDSVREAVVEPLVVIYLQDTLEHCLGRIHKRNRPYEQHIEIDFLRHLAEGYDVLYTDYKVCPVIRLHANECLESEQVDRLSDELRFYLKELN